MKNLAILGSTGSIGRQTLDVVASAPEHLKVYALVADRNVAVMEQQIRAYKPALAVLMDEKAAGELKLQVHDLPVRVEWGMTGVLEAVRASEVDTVVSAMSGRAGLEPTLAALEAGKEVALANKETLVAAGDLVMAKAKQCGCALLPVDSEHSAIFQCLAEDRKTLEKIMITASGGPFLGWDRNRLEGVKREDALKHPNWTMGAKITIDSATMMNKGLEVIEAHHLFHLDYDRIEVLIHPQSVIHSMVQYVDGSVLAQLGRPDMRLPIAYALSYPERWTNPFERLDLRGKELTFLEPDLAEFPALRLAYQAGRQGGTMPAVMNAANEIAVGAFLENRLSYLRIVDLVEQVCSEHQVLAVDNLETVLNVDQWARLRTQELI